MTNSAEQPSSARQGQSISAYGPARSTAGGTPLDPDELRSVRNGP
ncbi:MAG: hypothetical protein P4L55_07875 [Syntrophobacteraceae bacterium]|nr:hypothetical protein [Syntrophobacteraceae bacterium]